MPPKRRRVDASSSQNPASKSYSPSGQCKGRAICISPEGPTLAQVDAERARLEGVIEKLKARLARIDGVLATLYRRRRKFVLVVRRTHGVRVVFVPTYDIPLKKFQAKRNRATRMIKICQRRKIFAVPRGFHRRGYRVVSEFSIGEPDCVCEYCGAVFWRSESTRPTRGNDNPKFTLCCKGGKVKVPERRDPPEFLKRLLESNSSTARHFRQYIRQYNNLFCFISLGGKVDHSLNDGHGVYVYSIGGQIYHRIGGLVPVDGDTPKFAQLYIHETNKEVQNRLDFVSMGSSANPLLHHVVEGLQKMLDENNVLVQTFRFARDRIVHDGIQPLKIKLLGRRTMDGREYDLPTTNDVAALIVDEIGDDCFLPDIVVQYQTMRLERITFYHPSLMALQYPLIFPYGEDGWHGNISYSSELVDEFGQTNVSQCDFYSYRLQTRFHESSSLLLAGKLFQQYVVNAYAMIEAEGLEWIRNNQSKLRMHYLSGLIDSFLRGDTDLKSTGKRVILSSGHTGGPRYKYETFQDAMAICRWIGYPDLFITMTCNANWPEIQFMIDLIKSDGRKDSDRSDVIARVFKLKLNQLRSEIRDKKIFGTIRAYVEAIEFQKRGLPHAHILLFLAPEDKVVNPNDIDSIISAEIPNRALDPEGYDAVTSFMMHGPCGVANPKNACMVERVCSKHFPKPFCSQTVIDEHGFAKYRRRDSGVKFEVNGTPLDNRNVVPYNRYLLLRFQCHINVEFCNKSRAIKYLFKYINKPADRAAATLVDNDLPSTTHNASASSSTTVCIDEIKSFMDCRYITSGEACWRIFKFDMYNQYPSVLRMPFHLPGENIVVSKDNSSIEEVVEKEEDSVSMLMAWMQINQLSAEALNYTYAEFPRYYIWKKQDKRWQRRKTRVCIGRLYYSHPSQKERFYLRMLLHVVRGCTSFEDIKTVNGVIRDTFQEACYARGLLTEDNEWNDCLKEVSSWASGYKLRDLFVTILIHCQVSDCKTLWDKNWKLLSDDILYQRKKALKLPTLELSDVQIKDLCLIELEKLLQRHWKSLSDFPGLPTPSPGTILGTSNRMIAEELNYNCADLQSQFSAMYPKLNPEQKAACDAILDSVYGDKGSCFFVDGFGGTGKTFLWQAICLKL